MNDLIPYISVVAIGQLFLRKIFNDTFKDVDLSVQNLWKIINRVSLYCFVFLLVIVRPQKAQMLFMILTGVVIIALYYQEKANKQNSPTLQ